MIAAEAVEAAAKEIVRTIDSRSWDSLLPSSHEWYLSRVRAAIEAAVPYMLAGAWQAGKESGFRDAYTDEEEEEQNPYMLNNEGEK